MNSLSVIALTIAEKGPRQAHDSASRDVWIMFPHIEKNCASYEREGLSYLCHLGLEKNKEILHVPMNIFAGFSYLIVTSNAWSICAPPNT